MIPSTTKVHSKEIRSSLILTGSYVAALQASSTVATTALIANDSVIELASSTNFPGAGKARLTLDSAAEVIVQWTGIDGSKLVGVTGITGAAATGNDIEVDILGSFEEFNTLGVEVDFTKGSLDDMRLMVEVSTNGINFFQQVTEEVSSGIVTTTLGESKMIATGTYSILIHPIRAVAVKISVKGTGTASGNLCALRAAWSWS